MGLLHTLALPSPNDEANLVVRDSAVLLRGTIHSFIIFHRPQNNGSDKSTLPEVVVDNKGKKKLSMS